MNYTRLRHTGLTGYLLVSDEALTEVLHNLALLGYKMIWEDLC
jgi:hypothetical protein